MPKLQGFNLGIVTRRDPIHLPNNAMVDLVNAEVASGTVVSAKAPRSALLENYGQGPAAQPYFEFYVYVPIQIGNTISALTLTDAQASNSIFTSKGGFICGSGIYPPSFAQDETSRNQAYNN